MIFFKPKNKSPRYRLYRTWEPSFDSELKLAVSSFYDDPAFHRVFGSNGKRLSKEAITAYFIGMIIGRRQNPIRHIVTVRKDKELVAMVTGSLFVTESSVDDFEAAVKSHDIVFNCRSIVPDTYVEILMEKKLRKYRAVRDDSLEEKVALYSKIANNYDDSDNSKANSFYTTMIAVSSDEQRQGHLRAMLDNIAESYRESKLVKSINVVTYDQEKVELYQRLGFDIINTQTKDEMTAWSMALPIN